MVPRWLTVVVLLVVTFAAAPGVAARQLQTGSPTPFTGETFIGMATDGVTAVAVVIAGTGGDEREVRAYLCDGEEPSVWLLGALSGGELEATTDDGSTLTATLSGDAVTGTVTDPDGAEVAFTAARATGIAGLYDVVVGEDGTIRGTATDGRHLHARWPRSLRTAHCSSPS